MLKIDLNEAKTRLYIDEREMELMTKIARFYLMARKF